MGRSAKSEQSIRHTKLEIFLIKKANRDGEGGQNLTNLSERITWMAPLSFSVEKIYARCIGQILPRHLSGRGGDLKLPQPLRDMVKARFSHRSLGFSSAHTNTADRVVYWRIFIRDYTIFLAPRGRYFETVMRKLDTGSQNISIVLFYIFPLVSIELGAGCRVSPSFGHNIFPHQNPDFRISITG